MTQYALRYTICPTDQNVLYWHHRHFSGKWRFILRAVLDIIPMRSYMFDPIDLSAYADPILDELVSGEPKIDDTLMALRKLLTNRQRY
jgi:hypothetical protein